MENLFIEELKAYFAEQGKRLSSRVLGVLSRPPLDLAFEERETYDELIAPARELVKYALRQRLGSDGARREEWASAFFVHSNTVIGGIVAEVLVQTDPCLMRAGRIPTVEEGRKEDGPAGGSPVGGGDRQAGEEEAPGAGDALAMGGAGAEKMAPEEEKNAVASVPKAPNPEGSEAEDEDAEGVGALDEMEEMKVEELAGEAERPEKGKAYGEKDMEPAEEGSQARRAEEGLEAEEVPGAEKGEAREARPEDEGGTSQCAAAVPVEEKEGEVSRGREKETPAAEMKPPEAEAVENGPEAEQEEEAPGATGGLETGEGETGEGPAEAEKPGEGPVVGGCESPGEEEGALEVTAGAAAGCGVLAAAAGAEKAAAKKKTGPTARKAASRGADTAKETRREGRGFKPSWRLALRVLEWALTLVMVLFIIFAAFLMMAPRLGLQTHSVLSGSMEPALKAGGVVFCRSVPVEEVKVGDIISFVTPDGREVTHRVINIEDKGGKRWFQTKGDANEDPDPDLMTISNDYVDKVVYHIPYLGFLSNFMHTRAGFLVFICVPALALLLLFGRDFWSGVGELRKNRKKEEKGAEEGEGKGWGEDGRKKGEEKGTEEEGGVGRGGKRKERGEEGSGKVAVSGAKGRETR